MIKSIQDLQRFFVRNFDFLMIKSIFKPYRKQPDFNHFVARIPQHKYIFEASGELFLKNVPFANVRSWGGRRLDSNVHPILQVIEDHCRSLDLNYHKSALKRFVSECQPVDALQTLGLLPTEGPGLSGLHPVAASLPWEKLSPIRTQFRYKRTLWKELGIKHRFGEDLRLYQDARGEAELSRIIRVYNCLLKFGFDEDLSSKSPIMGEILLDSDDEWVVLIRSGEHRVAAMSQIGLKSLNVKVCGKALVEKTKAKAWPSVKDGSISYSGAIGIFDRIMRGGKDAPRVNVVGWP